MSKMKEEFMKLREKENVDDHKDEEYFYNKQVKPKTINENGKDSKNYKNSIQKRVE